MHIIFKNGLRAARRNAVAGLIMQGFALTLVLLYYFLPSIRPALMKIPEIKQQTGLLFPALTTAFSGGVIPFVFLALRQELPPLRPAAYLLFLLGFWATNGIAVDLLYSAQAILFGNQPDAATIVKKTLVDQFGFSALWSAPFAVTAMHWKNCGFSLRESRARWRRTMLTVELPSILISIWAVWIPAVAIIYSLPLALQFPLFNIVLCFWSLLLTSLSKENENETADE